MSIHNLCFNIFEDDLSLLFQYDFGLLAPVRVVLLTPCFRILFMCFLHFCDTSSLLFNMPRFPFQTRLLARIADHGRTSLVKFPTGLTMNQSTMSQRSHLYV